MTNNINDFQRKFARTTGLSESAIKAAWPDWWSEVEDSSASTQAELHFTIARKLGLDPRSLLNDDTPNFIWNDSAKFKNYQGDLFNERAAITSFGVSLGRILVKGCKHNFNLVGQDPLALRKSLLSSSRSKFIDLPALLTVLWGTGIPVVHLRVYPLASKRMCAMAVNIKNKYAILLAKDASYPAAIIFHLAHEIGHIALGHLSNNDAIVDMDDPTEAEHERDEEEVEADKFALALLTGYADFSVENTGSGHGAKQLAEVALHIGPTKAIEPGVLALCYGYNSRDWAVANKALKYIYNQPLPVWRFINQLAIQQIQWDALDDESSTYLRAVIGAN